jgi:hypothetical protein
MPGLDLTSMLPAKFGSIWPSCFINFSDIFLISPTSDQSDFLLNRAVRTVTLTELELCKDEIICTDQHEAEKYEFVF